MLQFSTRDPAASFTNHQAPRRSTSPRRRPAAVSPRDKLEVVGAIDLLFAIKPDSERLHQLAVGSLLRHSPLLQRLGVLPPGEAAAEEAALVDHQWEPLGGTYDLAVRLRGGAQVFIELKVDSALSDDQLRRQIQELRAEGRAGDRVLYLLLGYTAITAAERIAHLARDVSLPADRMLIRGADEVAQALSAPELLWGAGASAGGPAARDARDLAVAYRDHLLLLKQRVRGFFDRPASAWSDGDFYGFFAHCRREVPSMADAGIDYVANPAGGFVGCWWAAQHLAPGIKVYLQYEGPRLCVKIEVEPQDRRGRLRDQACAYLLRMTPPEPLQIVRPARLGHGRWMTIGYLEGVPFGLRDRFAEQGKALQSADSLIAAVAAKLAADVAR